MNTVNVSPFATLAAAYGSNAYGSSTYDCTAGQACETQQDVPLAPLAGFFQQPSYVVLPTLLAIAVVIGAISFVITKKLRQRR